MPCNANVGVLFSKKLPHQPIRRLLRTYRDNFSSFFDDESFTAFHAMCCMTPGLSYCTRIRSLVHNASRNEDRFPCVTKRTVGAFGCHEIDSCKCSSPAQSGSKRLKAAQSGSKRLKAAQSGSKRLKAAQSGTKRHNAAQCGTMRHNAAQCGTMRHNAAQCGTMRHNAAQCG